MTRKTTTKQPTLHKPIAPNRALLYAGVGVLVVLFFIIAFSTLNNLLKAPLLLLALVASSVLLAKLLEVQNYYGLLIIRGKKGFALMRYFAEKHPRASTALADLGLSLGFGALYAAYLFAKQPKKLVAHLIVLVGLFAGFGLATTQSTILMQAVGVLFGLAGVGVASVALNAFAIATVPGTPAGVMPVIPGLTVPFEAIFAIIIIAIIHETAHGVMFFANKLKVKHSGALLFGFIPVGAFVEPEDAEFNKQPILTKRRVLVAGSASNFYAMLLFLPLSAGAFMLAGGLATGVQVAAIADGAAALGILQVGDTITHLNGVAVTNTGEFVSQLAKINEEYKTLRMDGPATVALTLADGSIKEVPLKDGKLGISAANHVPPANAFWYGVIAFFSEVLRWTVLLNLALAVVNLLPLFITDGHKILQEELAAVLGKSNGRSAAMLSNAMGVVVLLLILFNMIPVL